MKKKKTEIATKESKNSQIRFKKKCSCLKIAQNKYQNWSLYYTRKIFLKIRLVEYFTKIFKNHSYTDNWTQKKWWLMSVLDFHKHDVMWPYLENWKIHHQILKFKNRSRIRLAPDFLYKLDTIIVSRSVVAETNFFQKKNYECD